MKAIRSVLVANRGDPALRVFRTCHTLGIRTIAVFSDADADGAHVRAADVALRIGPAPAAESYLDVAAVLAAARRAGADALHPGWGFLSESAAFAQAVLDAGLTWIGPSPAALHALGDKASARALAERLGVAVLPGTGRVSDEAVGEAAQRVGYPLLVKAVAGGGGRGQRIVREQGDLNDAVAACRREGASAFGDDGVLLERWLDRPRHVEVQVIGDAHGGLQVLGDRDCSIQRRNQKLFEEAPAPGLTDAQRTAIHQDAARICLDACYVGAGTVEFLFDDQGRHAFLEVNARLQVEHTVTEAVTGIDLVALQIAVAEGRPLPALDRVCHGHAVEARVVAEDPWADWRPTTGRLVRFDLPAREGVRVDAAVDEGATVGPHYDGLLAKVVAWGTDRETALRRLSVALDEAWAPGLCTNLPMLRDVARHPAFASGAVHTGFLAAHGLPGPLPDHGPATEAVAVAFGAFRRTAGRAEPPAFRLTGPAAQSDRFASGRTARWTHARDGLIVEVDGVSQRVSLHPLAGDRWRLDRDDERRSVRIVEVGDDETGVVYVHFGDAEGMAVRAPRFPERAAVEAPAGTCVAPGPGTVVRLFAAVGDAVVAGDKLVALEAMKVETAVRAPQDGVVAEVAVLVGQSVDAGAVLVRLAAAPDVG